MAYELDAVAFESKRVAVGLSSIIGVTCPAGQNKVLIKQITGGTLEIGGATLSWGLGYRFTGTESISMNSRGTFFLAAIGATCTVDIFRAGTKDSFGA